MLRNGSGIDSGKSSQPCSKPPPCQRCQKLPEPISLSFDEYKPNGSHTLDSNRCECYLRALIAFSTTWNSSALKRAVCVKGLGEYIGARP